MQYAETIATIDKVRLSHFERAGSRPVSRSFKSPTPADKPLQKARGRLRQAAYRCSLDRKAAPESDMVGMSLLTAAVKMKKGELDAGSIRIITIAIDDLVSRGYSRTEVENVFRRIKRRLAASPAHSG
jgi:hypothetical protein